MENNKHSIDWDQVKAKLKTAGNALERGFKPDAEKLNATLKSRAKILALEPEKEDEGAERVEIIEFIVAYEKYGVELKFVNEIYKIKELTPVPCSLPFVLGVINIRGKIYSVIDIKKFFNLPEKGITDLNKAIIVQTEEMELSILADSIVGVRSLSSDDIKLAPVTISGISAEYIKGVTVDRVVVIDIHKFLKDKKLIVHEEV